MRMAYGLIGAAFAAWGLLGLGMWLDGSEGRFSADDVVGVFLCLVAGLTSLVIASRRQRWSPATWAFVASASIAAGVAGVLLAA